MARMKQQGIHREGYSRRMVGMDQVMIPKARIAARIAISDPCEKKLSRVPTEAPITEPAIRA